MVSFISYDDADPLMNWSRVAEAISAGHNLPKASIADGFAYRKDDTLLSRAAWIDGMGAAAKTATVMPGNPKRGRPMIHGGVMLFDDATGELEALVDFHLVTKWKTAGDSLLGAKLLARPDSKEVLIIGAGTVARNLVAAYREGYPDARFTVWSRTQASVLAMVKDLSDTVEIVPAKDLPSAVAGAEIISCATMSTSPVLQGEWLQPGQHVDLIGAYRPDMREADDAVMQRGRIFVDSFETTLGHIGELKIPIEQGVITPKDVLGDFYDLVGGRAGRLADDEITVFKNGGGAHLDLMTCRAIVKAWKNR